MEKRKESGMKDVARVWERRIGKRRGVLKESDRGTLSGPLLSTYGYKKRKCTKHDIAF